jgi:hypothetical protein
MTACIKPTRHSFRQTEETNKSLARDNDVAEIPIGFLPNTSYGCTNGLGVWVSDLGSPGSASL